MSKFQITKFSLFIFSAAILSGCGGIKKMKDLSNSVTYDVSPKVLEMKNEEVELTITGKYPPKYFNKKATMVIQPVLKYKGGQINLKPMNLQGEAVTGNEKSIPFAEGGSFNYSDKFAYKDEYRSATVEVVVQAMAKDQKLDIGTYKLADGIKATSRLVVNDPRSILLPDKFVRTKSESKEASILYLINKADIRTSELKKSEIKEINDYILNLKKDTKKVLKGIEISSYASPDGPMDKNEDLSDDRGKSADKFFRKEMKKNKLTQADSNNLFTYLKTAEDWDGFKNLMEKSEIQDKELILRVLSMYSDPEVREREIKNISKAYTEIAEEILPQLRRSRIIINVDASGLSDEEMLIYADSNPDTFQLEELLYIANKIQDLDKKAMLYSKAMTKFPQDIRGYNNLGYVYIQQGKLVEAKDVLEKAKAIETSDVVKNNLAVVLMKQNDMVAAEELLTSSLGAGETVSYNLGVINILKGKYDIAKSYFGTACEFNSALAKVLNQNYEDALSTLQCDKTEAANVFYLRAIVGSRIENTDMLYNNLRTAVGKDSKLKAYAKEDAEFIKYFGNDTFKSIVE